MRATLVALLLLAGCGGSGSGLSPTAADAQKACGYGNVAAVDADAHTFRCKR